MKDEGIILVIEDDDSISNLLRLSLESQGYRVHISKSGATGLAAFYSESPALVLLDLGLPDIDGIDVLDQIRSDGQVPVVVVSAREQEREKVQALDAGADDYIVKPFGVEELYARIRVALRHKSVRSDKTDIPFELGDLRIDFERRVVSIRGIPVHFTPIEYKILLVLVNNRGKVLTHRYLQDEVWGYPANDDYQSLRVFVASIRRKLEDSAASPRYITTEVGLGYRFADE